jgi:hypothetical protein
MMKYLPTIGLAAASLLFGVSAVTAAQRPAQQAAPKNVSPIYGVALPEGYRNWKLISVAHEAGANNDIRAILGNDIAVNAYRKNIRPFPNGSIIVRLAYQYERSPRNDAFFPAPQSFVAGPPTNVQVSVKDWKRFPKTEGWGYAQFDNGKANQDIALNKACFACHVKLNPLDKRADMVFTHYSP